MNLFLPVVDESRMHPHFKSIYSNPIYQPQREVVSEWVNGFVDRDNKFVYEFQTTFNSSFWELYLFAIFKQFGFSINMEHNRPDFLLSKDTDSFVVEAVVANEAQGMDPEYYEDYRDWKHLRALDDFTDFNRLAMIRLSNSICSKHKLYKQSYSSLEHVNGKPFVIAIAPFHAPYHFFCADVPIRSVLYDYYVDEHALKEHPELYPDGRPPTVHLGEIEKDNGSYITLGLFNDTYMPEVSAIIFNPIATWGEVDALARVQPNSYMFFQTVSLVNGESVMSILPKHEYAESIFAGLQIYHNPYASFPLSKDLFENPEVPQCFGYYPQTDFLLYNHYNNCLMTRTVMRISAKQ